LNSLNNYSMTRTATDSYRVDQRFSGGSDPVVQPGANIVQVGNVRAFEQEQKPRAGRIVEPAHHGNGRGRGSTSYLYRTRGINSVFAGLVVKTYEGM
jgi:hypothetical protein